MYIGAGDIILSYTRTLQVKLYRMGCVMLVVCFKVLVSSVSPVHINVYKKQVKINCPPHVPFKKDW